MTSATLDHTTVTTPVLSARDLVKNYGDFRAVDSVSLDVEAGETVCILGPSGAGKSTFLRCLNLLERVDSGVVYLGDELLGYTLKRGVLHELSERRIAEQRARIGMVFQNFNLFPHLTVAENLMVAPREVRGTRVDAARSHALALLERVGLRHKANERPSALSGGQQQRVAIARALAMNPEVLLFDEPTSALDPETVSEVLEVMRDLSRSGTTMVVVTHEIGFARDAADRFVFMENGRALDTGAIEDLESGRVSDRCAAFLNNVR